MHINAKRPVVVPVCLWGELEELSKAALMDMVYSLAQQTVTKPRDLEMVTEKIRNEWRIIQKLRGNAVSAASLLRKHQDEAPQQS